MITKTLYTCQFCNTNYADKEKAIACEKNHKTLDKATIMGEYKSKNSTPDGCPVKIKVKFRNLKNVLYIIDSRKKDRNR